VALRGEFGVDMDEVRVALELQAVCLGRGLPTALALQGALDQVGEREPHGPHLEIYRCNSDSVWGPID
jgi:hypothetical protein